MTFQFPTLIALVNGALDTVRRFPMSLAVSILAAGISIYLIDLKGDLQKEFEHLWKIIMCCWLGLSLFLTCSLYSERKGHSMVQKYILQAIGIGLITGYYFLLPAFNVMTISDGTRYALFSVGLHLLVSFSPFIARGEINGFWQFNKNLFLRFLLSCLYSAVLYVGLALAMVAIDQLFGVKIRGERYGQLWCFLAGVFNTWFFLSGVPKNLEELQTETDYPGGLKIFTQFVLLPLVTIYLFILYAYGIKIVVQWELPKGWVSWLVNAFSVFGILSLLLIWPIRNDEGNKWISTFSRWFYRALFPLIILLGVSIGKRVMQYGITENRYFVLIVSLWLVGIAAYFLFSKVKNIKIIPVSLCIIAFLSSFGPWGAFSVSEKSQVKRLEKLLIEENILEEGRIKKNTGNISDKNTRQIVSIVRYLGDHHGFEAIEPWFAVEFDSLFAAKKSRDYVYKAGKVLAMMGVEDNYSYNYQDDEEDEDDSTAVKHFRYSQNDRKQAVEATGFDYSFGFNKYFNDNDSYYDEKHHQIIFGSDSCLISRDAEKRSDFVFSKNGKPVLYFDMGMLVKKILENNIANNEDKYYPDNIPRKLMLFEAQNDSVKLKLDLSNIAGTVTRGRVAIYELGGMMLFKINSTKTDTINGSVTKR